MHDRRVTDSPGRPVNARTRRPEWRGERRAVTARLSPPVAEALATAARRDGCSVSDAAARLIAEGLGAVGSAA